MGNSQNKKSTIPTTNSKPPQQFMSQNEFFETWFEWRNSFLIFRSAENKDLSNKNKWGTYMLNSMGPIGLDIYNTFTFNSTNEKQNIDTLLNKFDVYYIFGDKKKKPREDVYEYISELQVITKNKDIEKKDKLIKDKILAEIDRNRFATAAMTVLPTFTFFNTFNQLTLKEIAFIWMLYSNEVMTSCKKCGNNHDSRERCPALGKLCSNCNHCNHYNRRCPLVFINDCDWCGGCHFKKKCPAYNETCTKCQRKHHFSWKCQRQQILTCRFCGLSHAACRSKCPARNAFCSNCKKVGHFVSYCNARSPSHNN